MQVLHTIRIGTQTVECAKLDPEVDYTLRMKTHGIRASIWYRLGEEVVDGIECDPDDNRSIHIVLLVEGCVIGGCRLIQADDGRSLPTAVNDRSAVEISRLFLNKEDPLVQKEACRLLQFFTTEIEIFLLSEGYERAYATIRAPLFKKLQGLGIPMERIGENVDHGGKEFVPCRLTSRDGYIPAPRGTNWVAEQHRSA